MILTQRLNAARERRRPDNDPDLCELQTLWVRAYGSEHELAPVLRAFQNDPAATLEDYIAVYLPENRSA
jgi:hypothetical protein